MKIKRVLLLILVILLGIEIGYCVYLGRSSDIPTQQTDQTEQTEQTDAVIEATELEEISPPSAAEQETLAATEWIENEETDLPATELPTTTPTGYGTELPPDEF